MAIEETELESQISSLETLEDLSLKTDDSPDIPPEDIIAYNELRSCADLYRMWKQKILDIQPDFQRDVVWNPAEQTRFIDSLVKQLPIPSMCFAMDAKRQKWLVIDGLQRMSTIVRFLQGSSWKLSRLEDIDPGLRGKTAADIKNASGALHRYYTGIENLSLPVTVLRCDFKKRNHMEYLFTIFHRLNAGGTRLNNQEIRNCIYGGSLNDLLKELDRLPEWRRLNKVKPTGEYRFKYQEVMLRFFAYHDEHSSYNGQLAKFLNTYMHRNRSADEDFVEEKRELFHRTIDIAGNKIFGGKTPSAKIPITILESLLVGVAKNLDALSEASPDDVRAGYDSLINHPNFSEDSMKEGLSKKQRVVDRIDTAIQLFSKI